MRTNLLRAAIACVVPIACGTVTPADAQVTWNQVLNFKAPAEMPAYGSELLAKTGADECFNGVGIDYPPINADGTCSIGQPKRNQSYVWGLTQAGVGDSSFTGDSIWFGTVANPICGGSATGLFPPDPNVTLSFVCEYGESMLARREQHPLPASLGDWRMPHAYSYNMTTRQLTDRTPNDPIFQTILGLRSAGAIGTVSFMAGPTFQNDVAFAAWNAATGSYLGSCRASALNQIRQWISINGVLYAGAGRPSGDGVILRWTGTPEDPFNGAGANADYCGFEIVGVLPAFPSYLANYDGKRIAASAWNKSALDGESIGGPSATASAAGSLTGGVYVGPPFGADGQYTSADATKTWARIWAPAQYEQDPVVASTTGGGAITFWKGWLWFGSMQNNQSASLLHSSCTKPICFGKPATPDENITLLFNVSRAASIWRARISSAGAEVQLLYGQTQLPVLVPGTKTFQMKPTGWTPLYGSAGFNNPFATYTWAASASDNDLLFGMYDYRYVFDIRLNIASKPIDPTRGYGGDMWRFTDPDGPAQAESVDGLDNWATYGFRNMLRLDNGPNVIVGGASSLNLEPDGGWQLKYLAPLAPSSTAKPARSAR